MTSKRRSRSVRATEAGQKNLNNAKDANRDHDGQKLTFERIAEKAGIDPKTVKSFFYGRGVDRGSALAIVETALGLKITDIVDPEVWNASSSEVSRAEPKELELSTIPDKPDHFSRYLTWIIDHYEKWWTVDALTATIAARQKTFSFSQVAQTEEICEVAADRKKKIPVLLPWEVSDYAKKEHVLLVGLPGIGKSTVLLRLLVDFAKQELEKPIPRIPVLIRLKRYEKPASGSEDRSGILALIQDALAPDWPLSISVIKELLFQKKRFILLLDGLNEMITGTTLTELKAFRDKCAQAKILLICTTRESGDTLGIDRRIDFQSITPLETHRFLDECMPRRKQEVLQLLSKGSRGLGQTPFVLWMLYDVFQNSDQDVNSLSDAFGRFTGSYARSKEDVPVCEANRDRWNPLLKYLAFEMLRSSNLTDPGLVIRQEQAIKIFMEHPTYGQSLEPELAQAWLGELTKYHLLRKIPGERISFCHQLIQEYYAAEWLLYELQQHPKYLEKIPSQPYARFQMEYLNLQKWTEPIALMLGLPEISDKEALRVVELAIGVDLMLGARLAGEVRSEFQERSVRTLVDQCAEQGVCEACEIQLLGETCSEAAVLKLSRIVVESPDSQIRIFAIFALERTRSEKAIPVLLIAFNNLNEFIRMSAAEVIGVIPSEEAIPVMLDALNHSNFAVRQVAAQTLGRIGNKRAIPKLIKALKDPNLSVRYYAAYALQQIDDTQVFSVTSEGTSSLEMDEEHEQIMSEVFAQSDENKIIDFRSRLSNFLIELNSGNASDAILRAFADADNMMNIYALEAATNFGLPSLIKPLWQLQIRSQKSEVTSAIATIQTNCKFYNYEIFQATKAIALPIAPENPQAIAPHYYFPNAKEVKIFESVNTYNENKSND